MNTPFIATIKLITGEEILSEVIECEENGAVIFLLDNPIQIVEKMIMDKETGVVAVSQIAKKWMEYASDDIIIVYRENIITISELDSFGKEFYRKSCLAARISSPVKKQIESAKHNGYLGSIDESRELLEKMYKMSHDIPE